MKTTSLCAFLFLLFFSQNLFAQNPVFYDGFIGKYEIEIELARMAQPDGDFNITGRYRYAGKTAYLDLKGTYYPGGAMYLEESYNGKTTGRFYAQHKDEGFWDGKWVSDNASHPLELELKTGDQTSLADYNVWDLQENTSANITGSYINAIYYVNDYFFTEDNPQVEIGFNGGAVVVKEIDAQTISVSFDIICGPTYHIASFIGEAKKVGPGKYESNASSVGGDDDEYPCHLVFEFKSKQLEIRQESSSMDCGFGARAYADGTYTKVNDEAVEGDEEMGVGVGDVIPK